jgi:hypothetical protein
MADSITPTDIPINDPVTGRPWDLVLGYVDGHYAWPASGWARFPNSVHVRCAVFAATLDADVLDRENGDATASSAVAWVRAKRKRGDAEPTVYVGLSEWAALQAAFVAAGVPHPHYAVAAYPGSGIVQETLNGITTVFHQYADSDYGPDGQGTNAHYDLSVVADDWMGTDQPNPLPEDDDMSQLFWYAVNPSGWTARVFPSGRFDDLKTQDWSNTVNALSQANGYAVEQVSADDWDYLAALGTDWRAALKNASTPPVLGTVDVNVPTAWKSTDLGAGVTEYKAE